MRSRLLLLTLPAALAGLCPFAAAESLELSTGFLIGPRYDSRLFYVRPASQSPWRKSFAQSVYRKQAQGRLLGVTLARFDEPLEPLKAQGINYARIELQNSGRSLFLPDGRLDPALLPALSTLLAETSASGIAVELVLFHPDCDHAFETPDAILQAAATLTDWLIDRNHRHVLLNPAGDWQATGWDFDHFVPQNLERISQLIRERFQARRSGYALPIALSTPPSAAINLRFVEQADVLVASGDAPSIDPRLIERPVLVEHKDPRDCAAAFEKFAGCLVSVPTRSASLSSLSSLVLKSLKR